MAAVHWEVGDAIRALRAHRGLLQKDAAKQLGWKASALSRAESGTFNLTIGTLDEIAKGMNARLQIKLIPLEEDS